MELNNSIGNKVINNWEMLTDLRSNRILGLRMSLRTHATRVIEATFRKDHYCGNRVIGTDR